MNFRYLAPISLVLCLIFATPSWGQHAVADLEFASIQNPDRLETLEATLPGFNLSAEELALQVLFDRYENVKLDLVSKFGPQAFFLVQQLSQLWNAQAGGGQGDWIDENRVIYSRNEDGFSTELLIEIWDSGTGEWIPDFRRTTTRDENNRAVEDLDEGWDPAANGGQGDWVPLQRQMRSYNSQGNLEANTTEFWNEDTGEFEIIFRTTRIYDDSGDIVLQRVFESALFGPLALSIRRTFEYNDNGDVIEEFVEAYDTSAQEWENQGLEFYTYDNNGELIEHVWQDWDEDIEEWYNDERELTTFTPNSSNPTQVEEIEQEWDPDATGKQGAWVNIEREITSFVDFTPVESISQEWDAATDSWVNVERGTAEIDQELNVVVVFVTEEWDGADWVNSNRLVNTYEEFTAPTAVDDENPEPQYALEANYPNPFRDETRIRFTLPASEQVSLEVFDMLGRRITTLVDTRMSPGTHEISIEGDRLSAGLYLYRLQGERFRASRRMLVVK